MHKQKKESQFEVLSMTIGFETDRVLKNFACSLWSRVLVKYWFWYRGFCGDKFRCERKRSVCTAMNIRSKSAGQSGSRKMCISLGSGTRNWNQEVDTSQSPHFFIFSTSENSSAGQNAERSMLTAVGDSTKSLSPGLELSEHWLKCIKNKEDKRNLGLSGRSLWGAWHYVGIIEINLRLTQNEHPWMAKQNSSVNSTVDFQNVLLSDLSAGKRKIRGRTSCISERTVSNNIQCAQENL